MYPQRIQLRAPSEAIATSLYAQAASAARLALPARDAGTLARELPRPHRLRADLQAWAADALLQRYTFQSTFLFGCSAGEGILLAMLKGHDGVRAEIGAFVGIVVGAELRRLQAMRPTIEAADRAWHEEYVGMVR